ncbi:MAG: type II secretion system F family protein [Pseudomonadota bacterium]
MNTYRVHVANADGKISLRPIRAGSPEEARRVAERDGNAVVLVQAAPGLALPGIRRRVFDVRLFAHELVTLLQAGLSLVEALETIESRNASRATHENNDVLTRLLEGLRAGEPLSAVMERMPETFPVLLAATVAATEQTGDLAHGLQRYLKHEAQVSELRARIVNASLYPAMLVLVGAAVALFLMVFLVPRFSGVYDNLGTDLPLASRLLMQWGNFAGQHLGVVLTTLAALAGTAAILLMQENTRAAIALRVERMRVVGERIRLMRLARFYRSLGLLIDGGIPMVRALHITSRLLPPATRAQAGQVILAIERGAPLSESLEGAGLSTPVASRLLRAGERNGRLADMLERTAQFHDEEITRWIDAVMKLFEPMLMVFIGLVIGMIVVLLYLPIFELAGGLQ